MTPPPLVLASTSPQRRAILEQLRIPFEVVVPTYVEDGSPPVGIDPVALVVEHARGKARSVHREGQLTIGVDTTVHLEGRVYGKARDEEDAARMLHELSGRTHYVVSGLCLLGPGGRTAGLEREEDEEAEEVEHAVTEVTFRVLGDAEVARYVASGEWAGRAGAYAIQGLGAALVARIDGDYWNVVGLPVAVLVRMLAARFPGVYGFG